MHGGGGLWRCYEWNCSDGSGRDLCPTAYFQLPTVDQTKTLDASKGTDCCRTVGGSFTEPWLAAAQLASSPSSPSCGNATRAKLALEIRKHTAASLFFLRTTPSSLAGKE